MKSTAFLVAALLLPTLASRSDAQQRQAGEVLHKSLPGRRSLIVTRSEIPYKSSDPAGDAEFLRKYPGSRIVKPDRVWLYTLHLQNQRGQNLATLWSKLSGEIPSLPLWGIDVLDVAYDDEVAIVVYRSGTRVFGEVRRKSTNFSKTVKAGKGYDKIFLVNINDSPFLDSPVLPKNIRISLSRSPERISVSLTDPYGKPRRFLWNNKADKWQELKPPLSTKINRPATHPKTCEMCFKDSRTPKRPVKSWGVFVVEVGGN